MLIPKLSKQLDAGLRFAFSQYEDLILGILRVITPLLVCSILGIWKRSDFQVNDQNLKSEFKAQFERLTTFS
jgi:hypothetical protein